MPTSRQIFNVSSDTGTWGDTGPAFWGGILQMHYQAVTADTGADIQLSLLPKQADTGDGFVIFSKADCLGANWSRIPYQQCDGAYSDTGQLIGPAVSAGDRLRVKVTPGGAAVAGRLYVWVFDGH